MTPRLLATATRALRDAGSRDIPIAALHIGVVGRFRRLVISFLLSSLAVPVVSRLVGLDDRAYLIEFLGQVVMVGVFVGVLSQVLLRTLRGDPLLAGARAGLVVATTTGLHVFALAGIRRPPVEAVSIPLHDLAFAHIEPRRTVLDLPRFVFGHTGGAMSYEIAGKDVLQLRHAIQRMEEASTSAM